HPSRHTLSLHPFPTRRSSDLVLSRLLCSARQAHPQEGGATRGSRAPGRFHVGFRGRPHSRFFPPFRGGHGGDASGRFRGRGVPRSEEHTSELQSRGHLVCRLL